MPRNAAEIHPLKGRFFAARGMEKSKISSEARIKEKPTSVLDRPGVLLLDTNLLVTILKARPHGSFSTSPIVTNRLVSIRKTPGLDNPDRVKYIVRSLFPHVEPFQRQERSSCVVRREQLFTHKELKRAGGRLKVNTAPGIDGVQYEVFKEVIGAYPKILLEVFNSRLHEGKFFADWKKQRLVLLRKGNKPLGDASSYRPICLLDTMGKLLEEITLQRLQGHMARENGLWENQFGFRKGRSTVDAIQAVVDIATKARRATGKRKGFWALISIDIRNAFNTARWNLCIEAIVRKKVPDYLL